MDEFTDKAQQEISNLTAELLALSKKQQVIELKISGLKAYLAAAGVSVRAPARAIAVAVHENANGTVLPSGRVVRSSSNSVTGRVVGIVSSLLSDGIPRRIEDILTVLEREEVAVGGSNKAASVSSILSRDPRFIANRRVGWTLKKRESPAANEAFDLQPTP